MIGYGTNIVRNGLVLHLDAANPKSYPGSGTTWYDLSGNGNHGTLTNGPTFNSDNKGSIVFDGTNDRIDCGSYFPTVISSTNNFTIESIVYPENSQNAYADLWGNHNEPYKGVVFQQNSSNLNQYSWGGGDGSTWGHGSNLFYLTTQKYNHIFCVRNNGYFLTFLNAILIDSVADIAPIAVNTDYNFHLGVGWHLDSSRYWRGKISNFKIYNRALSAAEIAQNFEATRGRYSI